MFRPVLLTALVGTALSPASALAATAWGPVQPGPRATIPYSPQLGVDSSGNLTLLYADAHSTGSVSTVTRAAGASAWTNPAGFFTQAPSAISLDVRADGSAAAGWSRRPDSSARWAVIDVRSRDGAAGKWTTQPSIVPTAFAGGPTLNEATASVFAGAHGSPAARWSAFGVNDKGGTEVVNAASFLKAGAWEQTTASPAGTAALLGMDDAGTATVIKSGVGGFQASTRTAAGVTSADVPVEKTWTTDSALTKHVGPAFVEAGNGDALLTWSAQDLAGAAHGAAALRRNGQWTAADLGAGPGGIPAIAADGTATVAWIETSTLADGKTAATKIVAVTAPAGKPWGTKQTIATGPASNPLNPPVFDDLTLAAAPGGATVATWRTPSGETSTLQAAVRPAGSSWEQSTDLGAAATPVVGTTSDVTIDRTGKATVAWVNGQTINTRSIALGATKAKTVVKADADLVLIPPFLPTLPATKCPKAASVQVNGRRVATLPTTATVSGTCMVRGSVPAGAKVGSTVLVTVTGTGTWPVFALRKVIAG